MTPRTRNIAVGIAGAVGIALIALLFVLSQDDSEQRPLVTNFEECVAVGNPVMESFPRRCRTADGTLFVEKIEDGENGDIELDPMIRVSEPRPNEVVTSPLLIEGQARGTWFFEASFPVRLEDENGRLIAQGHAEAQGEWMTENFVPFKAELTFTVLAMTPAALVLEKDNPSGLPEHADERRIPVVLSPTSSAMQTVLLSFYNPERDTDASGTILCSRQGIVTVARSIPRTQTPLQDTVTLLLKGELTEAERAAGITTEFPLSGVTLQSAVIQNGTAVLTFRDPNNRTSGGACRAGVLWHQIEETAKQFPGVDRVEFRPTTLFQP